MSLNTPSIFAPTARQWKKYVCEPFELTRDDIESGPGWTESAPNVRVTSDALAGTRIGIKVKAWNGGVPSFYVLDKDGTEYYANTTSTYSGFSGTQINKWTCIAEGVDISFDSFSGASNTLDASDIYYFDIPDSTDRRWKRVYFGGLITYMDLPAEPSESTVSHIIPYMPSEGQGWTMLYNVHKTYFYGSTVDETGEMITDVRIISAPDIDSTIDNQDENTYNIDIKPFFKTRAADLLDVTGHIASTNSGALLASVVDKSFDAEGLAIVDTNRPALFNSYAQDGHTGVPQERVWLHFYDDIANLEADYAVNQMVAIMIIPM